MERLLRTRDGELAEEKKKTQKMMSELMRQKTDMAMQMNEVAKLKAVIAQKDELLEEIDATICEEVVRVHVHVHGRDMLRKCKPRCAQIQLEEEF